MSSLERALESFLRENGVSGVGGERLSQLIGDLLEEGAETSTRAPLPRPEPKVGLDVYGRYVDRGLLGEGGMGQVRRVLDTELKRDVAMKILRRDLIYRPGIADRFVEEAQATAQLRHPGIIPVHEVGRLPDGRHYFTMDVVRGETLNKLIRAVHMCSDATGWGQTADGLTFRRLVTLFLRACQAVAYAHSRGVLHRDIKPQNVMVGEFGEVQVLDWGLAKVGNEPDLDDAVETDRSVSGELNTQIGTVTGTPSYMAPEQARGQTHRLGPTSDVYSLGAMLYQVLSGRPPYLSGDTPIVSQVVTGPPPALSTLEGPPIPADLHDICVKAMSRLPEERYPDARALAVALQAWLDGLEKVEQAMALIDEAEAAGPSAQAKRAEAMDLRARADAALTGVPAWAPEEDKRDAWSLEQDAEQLEWAAEVEELEVNNVLHTALRVAPSLWPAHLLLAERYRHEHAAAEAIRDRAAAAKAEISLRHHVAALPAGGEDRERLEAWLRGDGQLTVETERPCRARLHRYRTVDRRLVTESLYGLGMTPVIALTLPMGSYLLELETPEGERVRYPFSLGRQEHWCPPRPVPVPSGLEPHEIYVPEGWFSSGGDAEALDPLPGRRLWCHGFVMRRDPITHAEFIAFLDALAARGEGALAERLAPRQPAADGQLGPAAYGRADDGSFYVTEDAQGDRWEPDWPVFLVTAQAAEAWCAWEAARTGQSWRLPSELEWEKAARGVDGRFFPFGDFLDPSWACMRASHPERPMPAAVSAFPVDESPYGVRGMAGNVRDWCGHAWDKVGAEVDGDRVLPSVAPEPDQARVVRGGRWSGHARAARAASRSSAKPDARLANLGFRPVRPLD